MENKTFFVQNQHQQPIYSTSLSLNSNFSYLSQSSGFDSQPDSIDLILDDQAKNESKNQLSHSLESLMDSDVFGCEANITNFNSQQLNLNISLWQFLLEMLEDKRYRNLIRWVSNTPSEPFATIELNRMNEKGYHDNEFFILEPFEVARRWAVRRNKSCNMTCSKFKRILRYYYNKKKILQKVVGKPNTFVFQINILPYLNELRLEKFKQEQMLNFHF